MEPPNEALRERAVRAALAVADQQGVRCPEPVVLRDVTNVLVHLAPPIVAGLTQRELHLALVRRIPSRYPLSTVWNDLENACVGVVEYDHGTGARPAGWPYARLM